MKKFPAHDDVRLLLVEDVREETGGKITIIGLFAGDIRTKEKKLPVAMSALTLLWQVTDGEGEFEVRLQVTDPTGQDVLEDAMQKMKKEPRGFMNVICRFSPFFVTGFGEYKSTLTLDNRIFTRSFVIDAA